MAERGAEGEDRPSEPRVPADFRQFYELEHKRLFGALALVTGNRHDAEELMQEAFLKLWERWDVVQDMENPVGYLYRTAMNVFRMRFRRAKMATRRVARTISRSDPLDAFEARFELDRGLAALTDRQRAALVLTDLLEFTSADAAQTLGIAAATVRKLASQGRKALRLELGADDG